MTVRKIPLCYIRCYIQWPQRQNSKFSDYTSKTLRHIKENNLFQMCKISKFCLKWHSTEIYTNIISNFKIDLG